MSLPLDIMLRAKEARRSSKHIRPHVCSKVLPDNCFVNAGGGLYVSTPEFCFFQLASEYPLAKLIELGFELCGSYSLPAAEASNGDVDTAEETRYGLLNLTTKRKLLAFAHHMKGEPGYRTTIKALQHVVENSASPMETILTMLLTLPYRLGGYGLAAPKLDSPLGIKGANKRNLRREYRCDLFWPKAGFAVEYDSTLFHSGTEKLSADSIRRSDLALSGKEVLSVTKNQVYLIEEFDRVAKVVAGKLNKRLRYKNPQFSKAQGELRRQLLQQSKVSRRTNE